MLWVFLSIVSTVIMYAGLKYVGMHQTNRIHVTLFNYVTNFSLGLLLSGNFLVMFSKPWLPHAIILGISIFIVFILLGKTSTYFGVSVTSLAHKISMIIPILFGVKLYGESINVFKISGIILALIGLILTLYKPQNERFERKYMFLPLLIFLIPGFNDTFIKYVEFSFLQNDTELFVMSLFFFSLISALMYCVVTRNIKFEIKSISSGLLIGIPNFGNIYFLFLALASVEESSLVFALNNIGTIVFSVLLAYILFKEKLSLINWGGILVCLVSVFILSIT